MRPVSKPVLFLQHYKEQECFRETYEDIFYQYGVDAVIHGHVHAYEVSIAPALVPLDFVFLYVFSSFPAPVSLHEPGGIANRTKAPLARTG